MSIIDAVIRTIACSAFGCPKTLTFDRKEEQNIFANPDNAWLKATRVVQTADGRNFVYCSDECEVKGTATGQHNIPEPKKIVEGNVAAVAMAAKAAEVARQSDQTLRTGEGGKVTVTD